VSFDIHDSNSRCIYISCVLLTDNLHTKSERVSLHRWMVESSFFPEFIPYVVEGEFLSPQMLHENGHLMYAFDVAENRQVSELRALINLEMNHRRKNVASRQLIEIAQDSGNMSAEALRGKLSEVSQSLTTRRTRTHLVDGASSYQKILERPLGILSGAKAVDDVISGFMYGTMTVVFGFVSHGKSTFKVNMMYQALIHGFNVCFITLEVPREQMHFQLLSLHSFCAAETLKVEPIPYLTIIKGEMSDEQRKVLFEVVEPDLRAQEGKFVFAELDDVEDFSHAGLCSYLASLPFFSDVVVLDYAQKLLPHLPAGRNEKMTQARMVGDFTHLAVGTGKDDQRIVILGSQANRDGWKTAVEHDGAYDLKGIADINNLERDAYYVLSVFMDDNLRRSEEIKVCLLKNKSGPLIPEPVVVPFQYRFYCIGDQIGGYTANLTTGDLGSLLSGGFDLSSMLNN